MFYPLGRSVLLAKNFELGWHYQWLVWLHHTSNLGFRPWLPRNSALTTQPFPICNYLWGKSPFLVCGVAIHFHIIFYMNKLYSVRDCTNTCVMGEGEPSMWIVATIWLCQGRCCCQSIMPQDFGNLPELPKA